MLWPRRIVIGLIVAGIIAVALDRLVLAPMRLDRALDALPRAPLGQVIGGLETLDDLVFLDDKAGWFAFDNPNAAAQLPVGALGLLAGVPLSQGPHLPVYCGNDTGRILWGIRAAQIVEEVAFCDPALMDLRGLRAEARPIRMERDLLSGPDVAILAAEIADDPLRFAVTLPAETVDLPLERVVVLPWIWTGAGDERDPGRVVSTGAQRIEETLADHEGAFEIVPTPRSAPGMAVANGRFAPIFSTGGGAAVAEGLSDLLRPIYRVRCSEAACAALDNVAPDGLLEAWRDRSVLDAALADARTVSYSGPTEPLPDRAALLDTTISLSPAAEFRHVVRVARRLTEPSEPK